MILRCAISKRFCVSSALQVRAIGAQQSPYIEELKKAEEAAQLAGLGLWTKVRDSANCHITIVMTVALPLQT